MSTSRKAKLTVAATIILSAWGCTSILGDFDVGPTLSSSSSGGEGGPPTQQQQPQPQADGTVGNDANGQTDDAGPTVTHECALPTDCKDTMQPAGCARAECKDNKCVYTAIDKDGDGVAVKGCSVKGAVLPGEDCNDDDATILPDAACTKLPNGTPITYPKGAPTGACKAGKWDCSTGAAVCNGAIAPEAQENCTLKNDANCDGTPDDGCDCTPNTTGPCGNVDNKPLPCKAGTRTCSANGKWGACVGNVEPKPRDCTSTVDNDCNGSADQGEAACSCPGGVAQGASTACTAPGALGLCANSTRKCIPSADKQSGVFEPCLPGPAATKQCVSPLDYDCDGTPDELQVGCGTPCTDPLGSGAIVAATQKFTSKIWGCGARRGWTARGTGCAPGSAPCGAATWAFYIRSANSKPPTHKYWVNEQLGYGGSPPTCFVPAAASTTCGANSSMTVCPYAGTGTSVTDPLNNQCNWSGCSYGAAYSSNDYFGGCFGNDTGGTLCCN